MFNYFNDKKKVIRIIKMIICLIIGAITYNVFMTQINLVAGGTGGIAILLNNLFGIDRSLTVFLFSLFLFILSLIFLDKDQTFSALVFMVIYPLAVKYTFPLTNIIDLDITQKLVITIFAAISNGITQGIIFANGFNSGGFSIISKIIYKYTKVSVPISNAIINIILVLAASYYLGISVILYAIIYNVIVRNVSERVMLGVSANKTFKIISDEYKQIKEFIHNDLKHDATIYDTIGSFDKDKRKMIMTVVPSSEYIILKDFVLSVDKNAFVFVTNTYDVGMQDITIRKETN